MGNLRPTKCCLQFQHSELKADKCKPYIWGHALIFQLKKKIFFFKSFDPDSDRVDILKASKTPIFNVEK